MTRTLEGPRTTERRRPTKWPRLPRDARDTLFQLAVIAWTILPHAVHLAPWCLALAALILGARAKLALSNGALPSRWTLFAVLVLAAVLTFFSERTLLGKEAGVTMLVVLMALKTLELRARRDAMVVFFLGFFLVLTNFLYSQSPLVALAMVVSVWGLMTALVLAHMPVGMPSLRNAGWVAARAAALGAPIMVALFLLFPRIAPLWGLPTDAVGHTGLSGSMELGGVASLANDDSVAFRIRFPNGAPSAENLYFRGPVLSRFNGRQWTSGRNRSWEARSNDVQLIGAPVPYEMTLEPSRLAMVPALELTPDRPGAAPRIEGFELRLRSDGQWSTDRPLGERVRVSAQAWPRYRHGPRDVTADLRENLALPPGFNPRTLAWAAALRERPDMVDADPARYAQVLLAHIRDNEYIYTLEPGTYGENAVDEFWLDRRAGFCEHYAASFVIIMRALGVPARVVTGYQGADPVVTDGYLVVRQSNAHAWAEYWQAGAGWVRADPTGAVAPWRIQRGQSLTPPRGLVANTLDGVSPALAETLRRWMEVVDNRWNQWVLNYSRANQFDLLRELGVRTPSWESLAYVLIGLLCSVSLAGAAWALWDRHRQDPWLRLQRGVALRLAALGVVVAPHDPPRTRAQAVRQRLGEAGDRLAGTLERLDHQRYGVAGRSRPSRRWWRQFRAEAARLSR